jgi:hypothetical protein
MKALQRMCVAAVAVALSLPSANAVCIYHGKMYAKTTLAQEFADSKWVVRVKVVAADNHWSDEDDSWTIYHLQVMTAFKGKPPTRIEMFTYRDSGGFYLDKGMANDLGGEYLLFLDPVSHKESVPTAARDATEVNYSCGQSKAWSSLSMSEHHKLVTLGQR